MRVELKIKHVSGLGLLNWNKVLDLCHHPSYQQSAVIAAICSFISIYFHDIYIVLNAIFRVLLPSTSQIYRFRVSAEFTETCNYVCAVFSFGFADLTNYHPVKWGFEPGTWE